MTTTELRAKVIITQRKTLDGVTELTGVLEFRATGKFDPHSARVNPDLENTTREMIKNHLVRQVVEAGREMEQQRNQGTKE